MNKKNLVKKFKYNILTRKSIKSKSATFIQPYPI